MEEILKKYLEREFKANDIEGSIRVRSHAVVNNRVQSYLVDVFIGGRHFYRIQIDAHYPFNPRLTTQFLVELDKLKLHTDIIEEGLKEVEHNTRQDDFK
nr:hypothetical protein [uncultured Carboxylicivirga sp.]